MLNRFLRKLFCAACLIFIFSHSFAENLPESIYLDAKKMLRMHRFEKETFQVGRIYGEFNGSVRANENFYREKFFDNLQRINRELIWSKNETIELEAEVTYDYDDENITPSAKSERLFLENKYINTEYNGNNQPVAIAIFALDVQKNPTDEVLSSESMTYDSKNRLVEENYSSADGYKERRTYTYTQKSQNPDLKVYENNFLVRSVVYSNQKNRTETTFFEDGFSVVQVYVNDAKISETVKKNGENIRIYKPSEDPRFIPKSANSDDGAADAKNDDSKETEKKTRKELREEARAAKLALKEEAKAKKLAEKQAKKKSREQDANVEQEASAENPQ